MSITSRRRSVLGKFIRTTGRWLGLVLGVVIVAVLAGCDRLERAPAPRLGGTFSGVASDGRAVKISLAQKENAVVGQGKLGASAFGLSAITGPHGPVVINPEDGTSVVGSLTLSPSGKSLTLTGLGMPITLNRGGTPLPVAAGAFAGRYAAPESSALWLDLRQSGELLAGTGFVSGKPVAVVGRVTETNEARGSILFSDQSQTGVRVSLSDDEQTLSVRGLGGIMEMRRK